MEVKKKRRKTGIILVGMIFVLICAAAIYVSVYYRADQRALDALASDNRVSVIQTDYGWYFDGPAEDRAMVFYPGAKVEETAYAAFLRLVADKGMDVCLVKMPVRLAILGMDSAEKIRGRYSYDEWYIGGHSMGGAMAAVCAANHSGEYAGVVLCAAYPTKQLDEHLKEVLIYGSEDGVLNLDKLEEGRSYASKDVSEAVIAGGNHAQFGDYGIQSGDGEAQISPEEQQEEAAAFIISALD